MTLMLEQGIERTTTAEALLGMLSLRPMSGYEIRQTIEGSIGNFWRESYGQIYPTLKRLVEEGLAEVKPERSEAGRRGLGRTVYQLTAEGRERLRNWLETPSTPQVPRNELLLKVFFAGQGAGGIVERQVEAYRKQQERDLEHYRKIRARLERDLSHHPEIPFWLMTLEYGEMESRAMLAWCEKTIVAAKAMEEARDAR